MEAYYVESYEKLYVFDEGQLVEVKMTEIYLQYQDGVLADHWFQFETSEGARFRQKVCYPSVDFYKQGHQVKLQSTTWASMFNNNKTVFWYLDDDGEVRSRDLAKGETTIVLTPNKYGRFNQVQIKGLPSMTDLYAEREDIFLYNDLTVKNLDSTIEVRKNPYDKAKLTPEQQAKVKELLDVFQQLEDMGVDLMLDYSNQLYALNKKSGAKFDCSFDDGEYYVFDCRKFAVGTTNVSVGGCDELTALLEKNPQENRK